MRLLTYITPLILSLALIACSESNEEIEAGGPINYILVKSKLHLSEEQNNEFSTIVNSYKKRMSEVFAGEGSDEEKMTQVRKLGLKMDAEIKAVLSQKQFDLYAAEIKIEREGREKHNMTRSEMNWNWTVFNVSSLPLRTKRSTSLWLITMTITMGNLMFTSNSTKK